jgi:hypothetical protein
MYCCLIWIHMVYFGYEPDVLKSSSFNLFAAEDLTLPPFEKLLLTISSEYLTLLPSSMSLTTIER